MKLLILTIWNLSTQQNVTLNQQSITSFTWVQLWREMTLHSFQLLFKMVESSCEKPPSLFGIWENRRVYQVTTKGYDFLTLPKNLKLTYMMPKANTFTLYLFHDYHEWDGWVWLAASQSGNLVVIKFMGYKEKLAKLESNIWNIFGMQNPLPKN